MDTFHARLRRLRKNKGLTIKELSQQIGVPETTYREWEYGRRIRGQPYLRLADTLGVSVYELLGGAPNEKAQLMNRFRALEKAVSDLGIELSSLL